METRKPKFNSEFYEDEGDPLVNFRKKNGGACFTKRKDGDPFSKDPDVMQSKRQMKLIEDMGKVDILGLGW